MSNPEFPARELEPSPDYFVEHDFDSMPIDTICTYAPLDSELHEWTAAFYDPTTGMMVGDGTRPLITLGEFHEIAGKDDVFVARVFWVGTDGNLHQAYIADFTHFEKAMPRLSTQPPETQEDFASWVEFEEKKIYFDACLIPPEADNEPSVKLGNPALFDHLDWLESGVDMAVKSFDDEDESASDDEPKDKMTGQSKKPDHKQSSPKQ